jgi:XAP5, circadian clock regulator
MCMTISGSNGPRPMFLFCVLLNFDFILFLFFFIVYFVFSYCSHLRNIDSSPILTFRYYFQFIRLISDATVEKDESHPGKVISYCIVFLLLSLAMIEFCCVFLFFISNTTSLYFPLTVLLCNALQVVQRHWYERNKHIFPASRWEIYDPSVVRDSYTIHGSEVA